LCGLARFYLANRGVRQPVQPHTFYARLLVFDKTSAEPESRLPDENFNKKPNSAKKRREKGQTDCLKARKKAKLYLRYYHAFVTKYIQITRISKKYLKLR